MSTMILLTESEAEAVRGPSSSVDHAALMPVALVDGRFILPVEVLDDPAHAGHHTLLEGLPTAPVEDIEHLLPTDESAEAA